MRNKKQAEQTKTRVPAASVDADLTCDSDMQPANELAAAKCSVRKGGHGVLE